MSRLYSLLAACVLALHLLFILWVACGALLVYSRKRLRWLHIASLAWGIGVELLPVPCPLTLLENWFEGKAGVEPYQGGFLLHYLDATVYPNLSPTLVMLTGVAVCAVNLGVYGWLGYRNRRRKRQP